MLLTGRLSKARVLDAITMLLAAGITGYGLRGWTETRDARQTQEAMSAATPALGRSVDALVISDEGGAVQRLSDVAAGRCRYIIIGTRTCPTRGRQLRRPGTRAPLRWTRTVTSRCGGGGCALNANGSGTMTGVLWTPDSAGSQTVSHSTNWRHDAIPSHGTCCQGAGSPWRAKNERSAPVTLQVVGNRP